MRYWWIRLLRYALPQWRSLSLIGVLTLLGIGAGLLAPWPMKLIVDNVLRNQPLPDALVWLEGLPAAGSNRGLLAWLAGATVSLFLLRRLLAILQSYIQAGAGSRMVYALASDLFDHLQRRSLIFHSTHRSGDLIRRVTAETGCVRELVMQVYLPLLSSLATVVGMFLVMWQLSRGLALFAVALVFPLAVLIRVFARSMTARKYQEWEVQGEIHSLAEQTLTAMPVVQAFGREGREEGRFRQTAARSVQATLQSEFAQHQFRVSTGTVTALGAAVVLLVGGISVLEGRMTVGTLLVLVSYFAALYAPIETLAYLSEGFASAAAGAQRVLEVMTDDDPRIIDLPGAKPLCPTANSTGISIAFKNVSFGYRPGKPVLRDVTWQVDAGQTVAFVGRTGAGKSTLVSLIPRLFDPSRGSVCFDGTDIRELQLKSVRSSVAIVSQQAFLLPLSIADNIAYGRRGASRDEVVAAAVAAEADDFIRRLPHGYETIIGERGVTLSGGERQRLSIARAILRDAPILILDEPTSALDAETEAAIIEALDQLVQGRTTIIIAHRLSTIRRADRIVMIEDGQILEEGPHDELLAAGGRYGQLYLLQQGPKATPSPLVTR